MGVMHEPQRSDIGHPMSNISLILSKVKIAVLKYKPARSMTVDNSFWQARSSLVSCTPFVKSS